MHDSPEQCLLKEIETYRNAQAKLKCLASKVSGRTPEEKQAYRGVPFLQVGDQLRNNRAAQHELETDVTSKEGALGIDNICHQLNNFSKGINYYGGIEKFDPT